MSLKFESHNKFESYAEKAMQDIKMIDYLNIITFADIYEILSWQ